MPNTSAQFEASVGNTMRSVPAHLLEKLVKDKVEVLAIDDLMTARPDLKGVRPSGYPEGMGFEHIDGMYDSSRKRVYIAERAMSPFTGTLVSSGDTAGVLRHELGHPIYDSFKVASGKSFLTAYRKDVDSITSLSDNELRAQLERKFRYELTSHVNGQEELFAEALAILMGGGADPDVQQDMLRYFPNVFAFIRKSILKP